MATLSRGYSFGSTEQVTAAKLHSLVDSASISNITTNDIGNSTITDSKVNDVSCAKLTNCSLLPSGAGEFPTTNLLALARLIYPVGVVVTLGVSTNPATLFGFGTWTAIAGRVIVGINASDTEFDTLDETGGSKEVTLSAAQSGLPNHRHQTYSGSADNTNNNYIEDPYGTSQSNGGAGGYTTYAGGDAATSAHTNLQPYIVKYVWQRTA